MNDNDFQKNEEDGMDDQMMDNDFSEMNDEDLNSLYGENFDNNERDSDDFSEEEDEFSDSIENDRFDTTNDLGLEGADVEGTNTESYDTENHDTENYDTENHDTENHDTESYDTENHDAESEMFDNHDESNQANEIMDFPIDIDVQLGMLNLSNNDAMSMEEGDILNLETNCPGGVSLIFQGREVGRGKLVDIDGFISVQITHNWYRA